jgi:fumarylacetoacetate (FAA) hydrolase
MRLATLRDGTRDGALIVVGPDGDRYLRPDDVAATLQGALDEWNRVAPELTLMAKLLDADRDKKLGEPLDLARLGPPLPRAYEWIDGSAFLTHVRRVRAARGASPPATLETDPLVYQGGSGVLLGPRDDIALGDRAWGLDFESEVAVILGDTPQGTRATDAGTHVRLVMLANDITLRNLVPDELAKGFGFFQSKPATAFSPFAVTPDELGGAWRDGRVHLPVRTFYNGALAGDPDAGEMHFSFFDLIAHIARTRSFVAGTILGSGTISNVDPARGISCLVERRALEQIDGGSATTPFMAVGDVVAIEMRDAAGRDVCGRIEQRVQGVMEAK